MEARIVPPVCDGLDSAALDRIENLIDRGLYLQVHPMVDALAQSATVPGRLLAVRALRFLGASRAGDALALRTGRKFQEVAAASTVLIRTCLTRYGSYAGYRAFERYPLTGNATEAERAEYQSLRALLLATLRDFSEAARLSAAARASAPGNPWLWVEWSYCCERADRYDEALAATAHALELLGDFRAAVQQHASLLVLARRSDEALALLREHCARSECAGYAYQLFDLLSERGEYAECAGVLDAAERLQPRADRWARSILAAKRTDLAMAAGDYELARQYAELVQSNVFYRNVACRLSKKLSARRVLLPVGFVRQHWNTCAPATLTALANFWGKSASHLEIAAEICYDGTPNKSERCWAAASGFVTREFRVDWDSTTALIDAGIPFTLTTVQTGSAHLQAVIGYDALRGSLLIRDPMQATHAEFEAESLFEQQRSNGPRGMLLVPQDQADRLHGIPLPDADLWDAYHALILALDRHDRDAALAALEGLRGVDATHRLAIQGARAIAMYDGDEPALLTHTERLLERFPDDANLQLSKAASLRAMGSRAAHIEWLDRLTNRPFPNPFVLLAYSDRVADDSRQIPQALACLRRAMRYASGHAYAWSQWAVLTWKAGHAQAALPLYRFAATLADANEDYAAAYTGACHCLGQIETGIAFLQARAAALGAKSPAAYLTLFEQLEILNRNDEAFAALEQGLLLHSNDPALAVYCAEAHIRYGRLARAHTLLSAINAPLRRSSWLRVQSLLSDARNDFEAAIAYSREAIALEPLNLVHHGALARQLSRRHSRSAAVDWLRQACERHPHHYGLQRLCYGWLQDDAETLEQHLRGMREAHPEDIWVLRELATQLTRRKCYDAALPFAEAALAREPNQAESHGVFGYLILSRDGYLAAKPHFQRSVQLSVDYDYSLRCLIQEAPDLASAREAIAFVRTELERQVTLGDSLLTFQEAAQTRLAPDELLEVLRAAHNARPDLWHAWVALGIQLVDMGRPEEALPIFSEAQIRFSMLPRLFVEHAQALKLLGRRDAARELLDCALAINPSWNRPVRLYLDLASEEGRGWEGAERVLRHALSRRPENADLRGLLAWLLEQQNEFAAAFEAATASLKIDPRPAWVWNCARRLSQVRERLSDFEALIEEIQHCRPGDPWAWVARAQFGSDDHSALAAAERALQLEPQLLAAWEARFDRLLRLQRGEEIAPLLLEQPWPDGVAPASLRLWAARATRGKDPVTGKFQLRQILADHPHDWACWRQLADWEEADGNPNEYLDAALAMRRISPNDSTANAYVGHALLLGKRYPQAIQALLRALELDPSFLFAGWYLQHAVLEAGCPEVGLESAERIWAEHPRADFGALTLRAACRLKNVELAEVWLARTLRTAGRDYETVTSAILEMRRAGWKKRVPKVIENCLREGQCAWQPTVDWVNKRLGNLSCRRFFNDFATLLQSDAGHLLRMAVVTCAAQKRSRKPLKLLLKRYADLLRRSDESWGQVSYAMLSLRDYQALVDWLDDWRTRPGAPAWTLANLATALASLDRFEHIQEVAQTVLMRDPADPDARFWQLVTTATADRSEDLSQLLAGLDDWQPGTWMKPVIEAIQAYHRAATDQRVFGAIPKFRRLMPSKSQLPFVRHLARRLGRRLARRYTPRWAALFMWIALEAW